MADREQQSGCGGGGGGCGVVGRRVHQFAVRCAVQEEGRQIQSDADVAHIGCETGPVAHEQLHRRTVTEIRRGNTQRRRAGTRELNEKSYRFRVFQSLRVVQYRYH